MNITATSFLTFFNHSAMGLSRKPTNPNYLELWGLRFLIHSQPSFYSTWHVTSCKNAPCLFATALSTEGSYSLILYFAEYHSKRNPVDGVHVVHTKELEKHWPFQIPNLKKNGGNVWECKRCAQPGKIWGLEVKITLFFTIWPTFMLSCRWLKIIRPNVTCSIN